MGKRTVDLWVFELASKGRGQPVVSGYFIDATNLNNSSSKYDAMGRRKQVSMPYASGGSPSNWTEYTYDHLSRVTEVEAPDSSTSKTFYNETGRPDSASSTAGQTVRSQDAWGRERWARTDDFGRLVEVVEPNPTGDGTVGASGSLKTSYAYNQSDELTTITQGSQTRSFKYDSLGRLTRQKLAEQTATINDAGTYVGSGGTDAVWSDAFVYDTRSNLTQRTDARGVKTNFSYLISSALDPLNRLQGVSYDKTSADTTYTIHDAAAVSLEYMTTGDKGRVKKVITSGISTEENTYDTEGRISDYSLTFTNRTSYPMVTSYLYDTASRLTEARYPAQYGMTGNPRKEIEPSYDVASRLTELKVDSVAQMNAIGYNVNGQVTSLTTAPTTSNSRVEAYNYDSQTGLLTGQTVKNTAATTTYLDLSYGYARLNSKGTLSGKTGQLTSIADNLDHNKDRVYEHDALGRLIKAKGGLAAGASGVTANWTQDYSYDRYGNKTGTTANGITTDSNNVPTDGLAGLAYAAATNRINTSGWEYDLSGNLIRGQNASGVWQKFEYDSAGRLVKIKDDSNNVLETYTYGASRERLVSETSTQRRYFGGGGNPLIEYTEATASSTPAYSKSYVYAGSRLLSTATNVSGSEVVEFHHPDRLGTRLVTKPSDGSSYQQSTLPFGTALGAPESTGFSNQVFTSYDRSAGTGLDYAVNRTYSSGQGRFTQVDPIGMAASSPDDPQSTNLYAYVRNTVVDYIDPSGLMTVCWVTSWWEENSVTVVEEGSTSSDGPQLMVGWKCMEIGGGGGPWGPAQPPEQPPTGPIHPPAEPPGEPKDPEKTDCETFVDSIVNAVESRIRDTVAKLNIGFHFADQTRQLLKAGGKWEVTGFVDSLVRGGQQSDVFRHVTGSIASILLDGFGIASGLDSRRQDFGWPLSLSSPSERQASKAGNRAGERIGDLITSRIRGSVSAGDFRRLVSKTLCGR